MLPAVVGFEFCTTLRTNHSRVPSDRLGTVYGIAEQELDADVILSIFRDLNIAPPSNRFLAEFGVVDTPIRIAQLVATCRPACA